jgi:hypothetical protein
MIELFYQHLGFTPVGSAQTFTNFLSTAIVRVITQWMSELHDQELSSWVFSN